MVKKITKNSKTDIQDNKNTSIDDILYSSFEDENDSINMNQEELSQKSQIQKKSEQKRKQNNKQKQNEKINDFKKVKKSKVIKNLKEKNKKSQIKKKIDKNNQNLDTQYFPEGYYEVENIVDSRFKNGDTIKHLYLDIKWSGSDEITEENFWKFTKGRIGKEVGKMIMNHLQRKVDNDKDLQKNIDRVGALDKNENKNNLILPQNQISDQYIKGLYYKNLDIVKPQFTPENIDINKIIHFGKQSQQNNDCVPFAINIFLGCPYFQFRQQFIRVYQNALKISSFKIQKDKSEKGVRLNNIRGLIADNYDFYYFEKLFKWNRQEIVQKRDQNYFLTDELELRNINQCIVFSLIRNYKFVLQKHAFVLKQLENQNWCRLDSANEEPKYTKPIQNQKKFDLESFFTKVTYLQVYVFKNENLSIKDYNEKIKTLKRLMTQEDNKQDWLNEAREKSLKKRQKGKKRI